MESLRNRRSPGSDRFLGLFSTSPPSSSGGAAALGAELHEDDVLFSPSPEPSPRPSKPSSPLIPEKPSGGPRHRLGILAALPEDEKKRPPAAPLHQLRPSLSPSSSAATSASASPSPSSAARAIPFIPKPKPEYSLSVPAGMVYHQSAPINVPVPRPRRGLREAEDERGDDEDGDDDEMLPPHEMVARASRNSPMTTFSVLEGAGRTLKGRDLRRVRNAVFRQTGFLD